MDSESGEMKKMRQETARLTNRDLRNYFEYSNHGIEVVEDGLKEMSFGEYLVERRVLSRYQLFRALQMQDRNPGVRIGECIAALGFLPYDVIESHLERWKSLAIVEAA